MAMSKSVSVGSIVVGISLLVLTLICVICGGVAVGKMRSSPAAATVGLWSLYFLIPGIISIFAGFKKMQSLLGVALGTHILGIILAIVGLSIAAALWSILNSTCVQTGGGFYLIASDRCHCTLNNELYQYDASCDDMKAVRSATAAVTIFFIIIGIVSLTGSIYGCIGTCCTPQEPGVVVTTVQQPATVVMTTQSGFNVQQQPPVVYNVQQQPPAAYNVQQQPPAAYYNPQAPPAYSPQQAAYPGQQVVVDAKP